MHNPGKVLLLQEKVLNQKKSTTERNKDYAKVK